MIREVLPILNENETNEQTNTLQNKNESLHWKFEIRENLAKAQNNCQKCTLRLNGESCSERPQLEKEQASFAVSSFDATR